MDKRDELIAKLEEYQKLLIDEIDDLAGLAYVHGWRSSRYEQGEKLRKEIANLKLEIKSEEHRISNIDVTNAIDLIQYFIGLYQKSQKWGTKDVIKYLKTRNNG